MAYADPLANDVEALCPDRLEQVAVEDPLKVFGYPPPTSPEEARRTLFAFDEAVETQRRGQNEEAIELYTLHIEGGAYWGSKYDNEPQMLSLAYCNRAAAYAAVGSFAEALEDNRAARALHHAPEYHAKNEAVIFNTRGVFALGKRDFESALEDIACATALSPDVAQFWANRCFVAGAIMGEPGARRYCEKALAIDPSNADAAQALGMLP